MLWLHADWIMAQLVDRARLVGVVIVSIVMFTRVKADVVGMLMRRVVIWRRDRVLGIIGLVVAIGMRDVLHRVLDSSQYCSIPLAEAARCVNTPSVVFVVGRKGSPILNLVRKVWQDVLAVRAWVCHEAGSRAAVAAAVGIDVGVAGPPHRDVVPVTANLSDIWDPSGSCRDCCDRRLALACLRGMKLVRTEEGKESAQRHKGPVRSYAMAYNRLCDVCQSRFHRPLFGGWRGLEVL